MPVYVAAITYYLVLYISSQAARNGEATMIKRIFSKLSNTLSRDTLSVAEGASDDSVGQIPCPGEARSVAALLRNRFEHYKVANLVSIHPQEFARHIQSHTGAIDAASEGYSQDELEWQRDLSVKFYWGHNHNFGEFKLEGRMGDRHIDVLANFVSLFPVVLEDFRDKKVFDIGCWTGGTALLFASLGSKIVAIEEVKRYADMASFLATAFGIDDRLTVKALSLYSCNREEFFERFDIVYFPGVVYHLSDPLIALRILFNSLRVGGMILVESAGVNLQEPYCRFDGSRICLSGTKEHLNRSTLSDDARSRFRRNENSVARWDW